MATAIKIENEGDLTKVLNDHDGKLSEQKQRIDDIHAQIASIRDSDDDGSLKVLGKAIKEMRPILETLASRKAVVEDKTGEFVGITKESFAHFGLKAVQLAPVTVKVADSKSPFVAEEPHGPVGEFQKACDTLYVIGWMTRQGEEPLDQAMRRSSYYRKVFTPAREKIFDVLKLAFNETNAGEGLEWVPRNMSTQVIELIRLNRQVAGFFFEIAMRGPTFDVPLYLKKIRGFKFAEQLADTGQTKITIGQQASTSNKLALTAIPFGTRLVFGRMVEEDAAFAIAPLFISECAEGLRDARETAIINGDTSGTHQDNDTQTDSQSSVLPERAFVGLRFVALAKTAKLALGGTLDSDAQWKAGIAVVRGGMGKYADPAQCALIAGPKVGWGQIPYVEAFRTAYAIGQVATNQAGQVNFRPDGMQYMVSEFQRENLAATGVNTSGGPNTKGCVIVVHRKAALQGQVREITLEQLNEIYAESDQRAVQATARWAFGYPYGATNNGENFVGIVYNIS